MQENFPIFGVFLGKTSLIRKHKNLLVIKTSQCQKSFGLIYMTLVQYCIDIRRLHSDFIQISVFPAHQIIIIIYNVPINIHITYLIVFQYSLLSIL